MPSMHCFASRSEVKSIRVFWWYKLFEKQEIFLAGNMLHLLWDFYFIQSNRCLHFNDYKYTTKSFDVSFPSLWRMFTLGVVFVLRKKKCLRPFPWTTDIISRCVPWTGPASTWKHLQGFRSSGPKLYSLRVAQSAVWPPVCSYLRRLEKALPSDLWSCS